MSRRPLPTTPLLPSCFFPQLLCTSRSTTKSQASPNRSIFRGHQTKVNPDPRSWARRHPQKARSALRVPDSPSRPPTENLETLGSYLRWREWKLPASSKEEEAAMVELVSHPLTYPLTLGRHCHVFMMAKEEGDDVDSHVKSEGTEEGGNDSAKYISGKDDATIRSHTVRLCCVGARAEATLPDEYWREMLLLASVRAATTVGVSEGAAPLTWPRMNYDWIIDFIGPEAPPKTKNRIVTLEGVAPWANCTKLEMRCERSYMHTYLLDLFRDTHEHDNETRSWPRPARGVERNAQVTPSPWDGFVLFNPGLGHPNLESNWTSTLRYILSTGKPVILTAHSDLDRERDEDTLRKMVDTMEETGIPMGNINDAFSSFGKEKKCVMEYKVNPFASRMEYEDPMFGRGEEDDIGGMGQHMVRPNYAVLVLSAR